MAGGTIIGYAAASVWSSSPTIIYTSATVTASAVTYTNAWPWYQYQSSVTLQNSLGTAATINNGAWSQWTNANVGYYQQAQWQQWQGGIVSAKTKREAKRQQAEWERQRAEAQRLVDEQNRKTVEIRARARDLLLTNLTPAQRDSLERFRYFDIELQGKVYRIHQGTHGNVREVVNGREVRSFCAQPDGVPTEDAMLAQKLMLETDEAAFLRVANARPIL